VKLLDEGFGILSGLQSFTDVHFLSVAFGVVILRRRRSVWWSLCTECFYNNGRSSRSLIMRLWRRSTVKLLDEGFGILSGLQFFAVVHFLSVAFGVVIL
jgi:hypothetical protein